MRAGDLRNRVTIQQSTEGHGSDYGGPTETWDTMAIVWASKSHKASRELFAAQRVNAETTDLFIIRYRFNMTAKMRLIHDSKTYDIIGVSDPDGRRRELHLLCKEIT